MKQTREAGAATATPHADFDHRLWRIGHAARRFALPHWAAWHTAWGPPMPQCASQWTCVRTALFVTYILSDLEIPAAFQSGQTSDPASPHGFRTEDGWESHAWVAASGAILDITADQFGEPEILIVSAADTRYRAGSDPRTRLTPSPKVIAAARSLHRAWRSHEWKFS
jgi:hypothetical protein